MRPLVIPPTARCPDHYIDPDLGVSRGCGSRAIDFADFDPPWLLVCYSCGALLSPQELGLDGETLAPLDK